MWLWVFTAFLFFVTGACSGLKVVVPSHTVHGIRGQALYLPVHYGFHTLASDIQIIWLFERPHTMPKYLLGSVNKSVVPDLEYQHKFTMMPPNASLLINPLQFTDEGNYIVKVNVHGNGTLSASQKIQVTVDGESTIGGSLQWLRRLDYWALGPGSATLGQLTLRVQCLTAHYLPREAF